MFYYRNTWATSTLMCWIIKIVLSFLFGTWVLLRFTIVYVTSSLVTLLQFDWIFRIFNIYYSFIFFGRLNFIYLFIYCVEATKIIQYAPYCPLIDALLEQQASFFIVTMKNISKVVTKPPFDYNTYKPLVGTWQTSSAIRIEDYWTLQLWCS